MRLKVCVRLLILLMKIIVRNGQQTEWLLESITLWSIEYSRGIIFFKVFWGKESHCKKVRYRSKV